MLMVCGTRMLLWHPVKVFALERGSIFPHPILFSIYKGIISSVGPNLFESSGSLEGGTNVFPGTVFLLRAHHVHTPFYKTK